MGHIGCCYPCCRCRCWCCCYSQIAASTRKMQRKGGGGASSAGGRVVLVALCDKLPVPRLGLSLSRGRALPCLALPVVALCAVAACCYFSTNWLFYWITQAAGSLCRVDTPYLNPLLVTEPCTPFHMRLVWLYWPKQAASSSSSLSRRGLCPCVSRRTRAAPAPAPATPPIPLLP